MGLLAMHKNTSRNQQVWIVFAALSFTWTCFAGRALAGGHPDGQSFSVQGTILDSDTGIPVSTRLTLHIFNASGLVNTTEVTRNFSAANVTPGTYIFEVTQQGSRFRIGQRTVRVVADTTNVDIYVRMYGSVSGHVLGFDGQPVEARALLIVKEYWFGKTTYYAEQETRSNDLGAYDFRNVKPGKTYFLLILPPDGNGGRLALNDIPPGSRRSVLAGTWYPDIPAANETGGFSLGSGEQKQLDMQMRASSPLCVEGTTTIDHKPATTRVEIDVKEIAGYAPALGLSMGKVQSSFSDSNGGYRVCDLWPGNFLVRAGSIPGPYGSTSIVLSKSDSKRVAVNAKSPVEITGDVEWEAPGNSSKTRTTIIFTPVSRPAMGNEQFARVEVAGPQSFVANIFPTTEYLISIDGSPNMYLKQVLCGGQILAGNRFDPQLGCRPHVVISTDLHTVAAKVVNRQQEPIKDAKFCLTPISVASREDVAGSATCTESGDSDTSTGMLTLRVPPGRYYPIARKDPQPSDWVEDLWAHFSGAAQIDVTGSSPIQITLVAN